MSFWGKLFGTEKALNAVVDGVSSGLDALVYTDEEKAQAAAENRTEARKMVVEWMRTTQGQNLARRLLALSITAVWLLQYILAQVANVVSVWSDKSEQWTAMAAYMISGASAMNNAVMLILAFYFAAPHMGDIVQGVLGKMNKDGVITKG